MSGNGHGWRIVLFTDASGAILPHLKKLFAEKGHELAGVVTAPPPKSRPMANRYLDVVEKSADLGIPIICSRKRKQWPKLLNALEPDLGISMFFVWKIPTEAYEVPRFGTISVHPSLLPKYRGPNPIGWPFLNDDGEIGVTVHYIAPEWDRGPILAQQAIQYSDDDNGITMMPALLGATFQTIGNALDRIREGDPGRPQDETCASYAPFFELWQREIDWNRPARDIHNQVRSWPGGRDLPAGALGSLNGQRYVFDRTRLIEGLATSNPLPGTVLEWSEDCIIVQCADGPIQIVSWSLDGEVDPSQAVTNLFKSASDPAG